MLRFIKVAIHKLFKYVLSTDDNKLNNFSLKKLAIHSCPCNSLDGHEDWFIFKLNLPGPYIRREIHWLTNHSLLTRLKLRLKKKAINSNREDRLHCMPNNGHAVFLLKFAVLGFFCDRLVFNLMKYKACLLGFHIVLRIFRGFRLVFWWPLNTGTIFSRAVNPATWRRSP